MAANGSLRRELPPAVVLAAGTGLRLENGAKPKPLACVAGATLLERAVSVLREVGIERIILVVGYAKDEIAEFVRRRGLDVDLVENADFALGNGSSALAGGRVAGGRFLLTMCDHVVDADVIRRMLESQAVLTAAVDSRPGFCAIDEATKVQLENGRVVTFGKGLDRFDAVDAGIFMCDAEVLHVAERTLADGEGSWNAVKRRCIAEGRHVAAVDVEGAFWIDVDTPEDARRAERLLVERAGAKATDGLVSRHLNRRLSLPLSRFFAREGVSPNILTAAAFALGIVAAAVVGVGSVWTPALVIGGLLVQAASVFDGVDGEVARVTLRTSAAGAFLDTVLDRLADAALLAALAVAAGLETRTWAALAAALTGSALVPYVKAAYEAATRRTLPAANGLGGRDARLLAAAALAVALQPFWALVAVAALAWLEAARRFAAGLRAID